MKRMRKILTGRLAKCGFYKMFEDLCLAVSTQKEDPDEILYKLFLLQSSFHSAALRRRMAETH